MGSISDADDGDDDTSDDEDGDRSDNEDSILRDFRLPLAVASTHASSSFDVPCRMTRGEVALVIVVSSVVDCVSMMSIASPP